MPASYRSRQSARPAKPTGGQRRSRWQWRCRGALDRRLHPGAEDRSFGAAIGAERCRGGVRPILTQATDQLQRLLAARGVDETDVGQFAADTGLAQNDVGVPKVENVVRLLE